MVRERRGWLIPLPGLGSALTRWGRAELLPADATGEEFHTDAERRLLAMTDLPQGARLLEIGCGEGDSLALAEAGPGSAGVDLAAERLRLARSRVDGVNFARGDALRLPFATGAFDAVLVRDVLHRVRDATAALREAWRVLRWGGQLGVIEPNRQSPAILAKALLVGAERTALSSDEQRLRRDLARAGFCDVGVERAQPAPLAQLVDPRRGVGFLASRAGVGRWLGVADLALEALVPKASWTMLVARGRKPA